VLLPLLLQPCTLLLLLPVNPFSIFPSALFFGFVALLAFLAPALLFCLALLLTGFVLLLFPTFSLFPLCSLFSFNLALVLELLLPDGFSLFSPCLCLLCPFLVSLAPSLLLFSRSLGANLKTPVLSHLGQALLLDQVVEQGADSVHDVSVDVDALSRAFNKRGRHARVFGQQRGVAVGLVLDQVFEGGQEVVFGRLEHDSQQRTWL
jgi:hypothetical protein